MLYSAGGLAGYAAMIGLTELLSRRWAYTTAVRPTGQGFCWNMARSIAALGPLVFGWFYHPSRQGWLAG